MLHHESPGLTPPIHDLVGRAVLVTGGSGFLGTRVVDALVQAGAHVVAVDVQQPPWQLSQVRYEYCDVRSTRFFDVVAETAPSVLVHLAGPSDIAAARHWPSWDVDVRVGGTLSVVQSALSAGTTLMVAANSCLSYAPTSEYDLPISEHAPMQGNTPYGFSAAHAVRLLDWYGQWLPNTTLLFSSVYGPPGTGGRHDVVTQLVRDAACGRPSELPHHRNSTHDFLYVDDAVEAVVRACTRPAVGRVNIGSGVETSMQQIVSQVRALFPHSPHPRWVGMGAHDEVSRMCLDTRRAAGTLGLRPRVSLAAGLRDLALSLDLTTEVSV